MLLLVIFAIILLVVVAHVVVAALVIFIWVACVRATPKILNFATLIEQIEVQSAQQKLQIGLHLIFELLFQILEIDIELSMNVFQLGQWVLHN